MRKLTYWCCSQEHDNQCYNIRARTKRHANYLRSEYHEPERYSKPFKVTVEYKDAFELMDRCMAEGTIYEIPS
jgi:hypothetical protein